MRRLLRWFVFIPVGILLILFAVANRAPVVLSFDPFSPAAPAFAISLPLFVIVLLAMIAGVIVGGSVAGFARMRLRSRARRAEREAEKLQTQNDAFANASRASAQSVPGNPLALR